MLRSCGEQPEPDDVEPEGCTVEETTSTLGPGSDLPVTAPILPILSHRSGPTTTVGTVLSLPGPRLRPFEGLYRSDQQLAELQTPVVELGVADLTHALLGLYGVHPREAILLVDGDLQ